MLALGLCWITGLHPALGGSASLTNLPLSEYQFGMPSCRLRLCASRTAKLPTRTNATDQCSVLVVFIVNLFESWGLVESMAKWIGGSRSAL